MKKITMILVTAMLVLLNNTQVAFAAEVVATDTMVNTASTEAIDYQETQQNTDGSIAGYGSETDWQIIANAAFEDANNQELASTDSLVQNIEANPMNSTASTTDIERRILAITSVQEDPTNFGGFDYKTELASRYNNSQIGDQTLLNDDFFGLMAIDSLNDPALDNIAQDSLNFIISNQESDGGFSYTTDDCAWCGSDSNDTAAAIISLYSAQNIGVTNSLIDQCRVDAINYLLSTQNDDGGFGYDIYSDSDGSSTAWSLIALNTIGDSVLVEANRARAWIIAHQNPDGGFSYGLYGINNSDTFTTAHSIIALLGTNWIMSPTATSFVAPVAASTATSSQLSANILPAAAHRNSVQVSVEPINSQQADSGFTSKTVKKTDKSDHKNKKSPKQNYLILLPILLAFAVLWWIIGKRRSKEEEKND